VAPAERWRPTRAGIRNIWEYDDQVFEFADGRLVLRGPNGSGKSNALALLVPFLLDGVMAAYRMDSLSGGRSMKTLLLCLAEDERSNRFRHEQRTGYTWLEFERDGDYVTIGCGARASTQRDAEAWFFVTSRRPGIDLDLAPGGVPLSKGGLADTLGTPAVHDSADSYRAAVDRALFGLGARRYNNLIELLLVLRRPHLAGKLNLDQLSKVLSDGLAGLDDQLVADVAASFDDLEAVQRDLHRLQEAHRTVEGFLPVYRRYLRAVAHDRAVAATEAARGLRAARRRVVEAQKDVASAGDETERLRLARLTCDEDREIAEERQRAVLVSPAYRDAKSLGEIEERLAHDTVQLGQAEQRLATAQLHQDEALAEQAHADELHRQASAQTDRAFAAVTVAADGAGVAWALARAEVASANLAQVVRGLGGRRRQDIVEVRAALAQAESALAKAETARTAAALATEEADQTEAGRREAADKLDGARSQLADELRSWVAASGIPELDSAVEVAATVGDPGAPALMDIVAEGLRPRRDDLAAKHARAEDLAKSLVGQHSELVAERQRVADDPVPAPDRLATRPADRSGRLGAPLYACCDFAEVVPAEDRAGLEAALEAAGLLDAWISPAPGDGHGHGHGQPGSRTGHDGGDLDAWLQAGPPIDGPTLADVLVPTPPDGSGLRAEAVRGILVSISLAEAGVTVRADGRFALGPLSGRFAKPAPDFVGATAREQRRQRLLSDLDERIADLSARLAAVAQERSAIAAEQQRLAEVSASVPSQAGVLTARDELMRAVAKAGATREAATRADATAREAAQQAEEKSGNLRALAASRRLPVTADGLQQADSLVRSYEQHADELVHSARSEAERRAGAEGAAHRLAGADHQLAGRRTERDDLHRHVRGLEARVDQLRSQLGADAGAPLRELAAIEEDLRRLRHAAEDLSGQANDAAEHRGRALQELDAAVTAVEGAETSAAGSAARLDVLRRNDIWSVVAIEPAPPEGAIELAAAVTAATADVAAEADDNALQRAYRQLLDELGRGYDPGLSYLDHVAVVEVTSDAGTFSVLWLARELGEHVSRQQDLLSERDREIFERHLLTRVSEALRELLNDAHDLVKQINQALADRPTASGKSVQLRWELSSPDPAIRDALGLLRKTPELLGPAEREQLRRFFSTAIEQRRAEDAASGYAEILRHVLDYRSWHIFVPHVRSAGGGVQRLTRTLFQSLSGGEQAVVLHLPLFAAAAAHYNAATEIGPGPRLIALDEAFAGIDEGMRAELMGLLVRFDLDIVLTGHELWGAYEQVPALMVYDLLRRPPLEGVSALAARWDGAAMAEA
jgi:uncharacterized protein (TIGR02680 family)